jgi:hypothetical protein
MKWDTKYCPVSKANRGRGGKVPHMPLDSVHEETPRAGFSGD